MKKGAMANPDNTSCSVAKLLNINHLTSYCGIQEFSLGIIVVSHLLSVKKGFHCSLNALEKNIVTTLKKKKTNPPLFQSVMKNIVSGHEMAIHNDLPL